MNIENITKQKFISPEELIDKVIKSIDHLKKHSKHLFTNNVHEIAVVHQIACILDKHDFFSNYSIDLEYNRITGMDPNQTTKKTFEDNPEDYFRPDLIVHIPRTQLANLLVIEFSKEKDIKREEDKLREMTKRSGKYGYRIGILIDFPKCNSKQFFIDGKSFNHNDALKRLEELENIAEKALNSFQNINFNNTVRGENYNESEIHLQTIINSVNNPYLGVTYDDLENIDSKNNLELEIDCMNFSPAFRKYFQTVFIPKYLKCSEIIDNFYKYTFQDAYDNNTINFEENWLTNSGLVFPFIYGLCLYCNNFLTGNKKESQNNLSDLEEHFKDPAFSDGSLNF